MVEFGVSLPTIGMDDPAAVRLVAEQAESAGLDSVWAADHIVLPTGETSPYPYSEGGEFLIPAGMPFMDQFTTLSYVAGFTKRLKLGTAVNLLPLRHPLTVAKIVSTLDVLSGGRTILGVAAGWLEEEFTALGVNFNDRGALLNEGLEVLQQAWTQPEANYHGQHYQVEGVASYPQPVQKPHPPIWVGGHTRPVMRRAAKYGSMWMPPLFKTTPERMAEDQKHVRAMAEEEGRGPDAVGLALRVLVDLRAEPDASGAEKRSALVGSSKDVVEALKGYVHIGVGHFIFLPQARTLADVQETVDQLAQEVIPQLREAAS
jgi:probable F420-dependent oxidoreductase